jgi:hypothetical protein
MLVSGGQFHSGIVDIELWSMTSTGTWTGRTVTINLAGSSTYFTGDVWGVSGANTGSPFDGSAINGGADPLSITTTNANDILVGGFRMGSVASPTAGAGYTTISGADNQLAQYKILSATGTNSFTIGTGAGNANGGVVAAVKRSC